MFGHVSLCMHVCMWPKNRPVYCLTVRKVPAVCIIHDFGALLLQGDAHLGINVLQT